MLTRLLFLLLSPSEARLVGFETASFVVVLLVALVVVFVFHAHLVDVILEFHVAWALLTIVDDVPGVAVPFFTFAIYSNGIQDRVVLLQQGLAVAFWG